MFEPHPLHRRRTEATIEWGAYASEVLGIDDEAPWDNAAPLFKWSKAGGEEDSSWKEGEVADPNGHHKRSNETDLAKRELDYGLALYCVECGFGGSATIWGSIEFDFLALSIETAQVGFQASFKAGLNLGIEAYVKYEKEWEKELARIPLGGFSIPVIADIGPFVSLSVEAKAGVSATGSLLIGAAVAWDDVDIVLDLLDSGGSHVNGLTPRFEHKAEATGELKIEASIGLPVRLGVGIEVAGGLWSAAAAIKYTPSINAEGKFEVSATVTDDGEIVHDINGGCYGIAWDIHFENTLQAVIEADYIGSLEFDLIEPQESDPIAEGCIGYVDDGTDNDNDSQGVGSGTGTTGNGLNTGANGLSGGSGSAKGSVSASGGSSSTSSMTTVISSTSTSTLSSSTTVSPNKVVSSSVTTTASTSVSTSKASSSSTSTTLSTTPSATKPTTTTTSTKPACTPSQIIANPTVPAGLTCKKIVAQASVATSFNVGKATTVNTVDLCAANCLKDTKCVSFSYNDKNACQLYNKAVKSVGVTTKKGEPQLTFYDTQCYAYSTCPK
jgi:cell division septation protein DedD